MIGAPLDVRACAASLVAALMCGCAMSGELSPELRRPVDARQLIRTGFESPAELVVRDAQAWRDVWGRLAMFRRPLPAAPDIDFAKDFAVIVAMGKTPSGGYSVQVVSVEHRQSGVVVNVRVTSPGKTCITTADVTSPADVVLLQKGAEPVVFETRRVTRECG